MRGRSYLQRDSREMFFKKRTAAQRTGSTTPPARPTVHVTSGGGFYVDVDELFESEVGQETLRQAAELSKRLGLEHPTAEVELAAQDRVSTGD